ncbi:hypothetical protein HHI36_004464 [Cryptolaemus montrouzieri]|uniref:EFHB C-terminal EF-hand domain-containing protein n=1 Tax=Cryptolaemus montrouzieri TaxID=559131 RepID=A0ABD2NRB1_9CUCU
MANDGKFRDTCPIICAAGLRNKSNYKAVDSFKWYSLEDGINALKAENRIPEKEYKPVKLPKVPAIKRSPGVFVQSRELLTQPSQTRYQQLMKDLKESTYESYWNKNLGTPRDNTPAFPESMKVEEVTFGVPYNHDATTVKDLIRPAKTPYQVLWDSQVNHDTYKKIYGSYNIGEHIDRGYKSPPYNPDQSFGKYCGYDKRGLKAKCCSEWIDTNPVCAINKKQRDWLDENQRKVGKCFEPNQLLDVLPKGHTFGIPNRKDFYDMADLLRQPGTPVPTRIKELRACLVSLNRLRMHMEKRIEPTFDYNVLYQKMRYFDTDQSGFIPFGRLLEVMRCCELFFNIANVKNLMEHFKIIVDDRVNYGKFLDSVKGKIPLGKLCDLSPEQLHFLSTYQAQCCDYFIPDRNVGRPVAGIPVHRIGERKPANPYSDSYINLSEYTDVKAILQPSIFTQYSLSHRDFFCPRDEVFIKTLFRNVGYNISEESFAKLWKIALERDNTGKVCVETFRDLLKEYYPLQKKLSVDEVAC